MEAIVRLREAIVILAMALIASSAPARAAEKVVTMRVPNGGNAPQVAVDDKGVVHLIYFKAIRGDRGDIYYVRSADGGATFTDPIPVNTGPSSAIPARPPRGAGGRSGS